MSYLSSVNSVGFLTVSIVVGKLLEISFSVVYTTVLWIRSWVLPMIGKHCLWAMCPAQKLTIFPSWLYCYISDPFPCICLALEILGLQVYIMLLTLQSRKFGNTEPLHTVSLEPRGTVRNLPAVNSGRNVRRSTGSVDEICNKTVHRKMPGAWWENIFNLQWAMFKNWKL